MAEFTPTGSNAKKSTARAFELARTRQHQETWRTIEGPAVEGDAGRRECGFHARAQGPTPLNQQGEREGEGEAARHGFSSDEPSAHALPVLPLAEL